MSSVDPSIPRNGVFSNRAHWGEGHALYVNPFARGLALVVAFAVAVVGLSIGPSAPAQAAIVSWGTNGATAPSYQTTVNGDFAVTGNGVLACGTQVLTQQTAGSCTNLHAASFTGTGNANSVNDSFTMINSNTVPGFTTNSSSGAVTVPSGATVTKAFLSWSANTGVYTGQSGAFCVSAGGRNPAGATLPGGSATAYRTQPVQLKVGGAAVTSVPVGTVLEDPTTQATALYYSAGADVTSAFADVATGSAVTISAGNIWTPTGAGCYAGWSLTVVYDFGTYVLGNDASAPRRVIYYEGHVREGQNEPDLEVDFSGFTASGAGTKFAYAIYEGDRQIVGDTAEYSRNGSTAFAEIRNSAGALNNIGIGRAVNSVRYTQLGDGSTFTNQSVEVAATTLPNVVAGDSTVDLRIGTTGDSYLLRSAVLSVPTAGIQISKSFTSTADTQSRVNGELATFTITILNTSITAVQNIVVTDDQANCARTLTGVTLQPLQSTTYTCTAGAGTTANYTSTAVVTAYTVSGAYLATDNDSTQVVYTAIGLTKTSALAAGATGRVGDVVTYTFVATNTGASTLTGVTVTDPLSGLSALAYAWPGASGVLTAGQSVTATATYALKQTDVDAGAVANTATTTGADNDGGVQPTATANRTQNVTPNPALTVTKSGAYASGATGRVGDRINYTFTVTNTGNVTLTNTSLVDPLPGLSPPVVTWPTSTAGTLAPGAVATATAFYLVKQADVDAGSVRNTASATGMTPKGATTTASSPQISMTTVAASPSLTTAKSGTYSTGSGAVGSVIRYTFTATNTGNVTLSGVVINDPLPGLSARTYSWPGAAGTLLPGQVVTATATYTVTQSDVDSGSVRNTATTSSTTPAGATLTAASPLVTTGTAASAPAVTLSKSGTLAAGGSGRVGDIVNYAFTLTNSGNVTLTGAGITDPLSGLSAITYGSWPSGTVGTLAPGQSVTATATYALKQTDVDAGAVANTATATGRPPTGANVTQQRPATVAVTAAPAITVAKSGALASGATGVVGDTVNYSFTVRNAGNVTLTQVAITDPLAGLSAIGYAWPGAAGTLAPGQSVVATATYVLKQTDVDAGGVRNTATASGKPPTGANVTGTSAQVTVATAAANPSIVTTKSATVSGTRSVGDVVTYSFSARNSGNVTLTGVAIADPLAGLSARAYTWPGSTGTLAPGQTVTATATYTITQADVDAGSVRNTATSSGTTPAGGTVTGASPQVTTATVVAAPSVTLVKSGALAAGSTGRAGDTVNYTFAVRNAGNVTLTGVGVTDPLSGLSAVTFGTWPSGTAGTLAPGQTVVASATYVLKQSDVDAGSIANTATTTGTPPTGAAVTATSPATVPVSSAPALLVTKSGAASGTATAGNTITYSFSARNTGNVTLTGVAIDDPLPGLSARTYTWPGTTGRLLPGQTVTATATYVITQADVDSGSVRNTASATGTPPTGPVVTASSPQSTIATAAQAPSIVTTKSATPSGGAAGSTVTYSFSARNAGNVTLTGVVINDPLPGLSARTYSWPGTAGTLAPGQTVTATATYLITQADVDAGSIRNTATTTATSPAGVVVSGASPQVTTATAASAPAIVFSKSGALAAGGTGRAGDTVNYTFSVRNSGNVTLTGVAITDPLSGFSAIAPSWPGTPGTLIPGATVTATATYVLKQTDVDAGAVANTATATGTPPTGAAVTQQRSSTVAVSSTPQLVVTKDGVVRGAGAGAVGQIVDYGFTIRNAGNVTLTQVTLTDSKAGVSTPVVNWPGTVGTIAPNQTVTATASYTITQADVDAGVVRNTATVSGKPPVGVNATASSAESVVSTASQAPAITTTKSAVVAGGGAVGSTITYSLRATNAGNVTLTGVTIADPLAGLSALSYGSWPSGAPGTLAPGQSVTATATYAVKQSDVDAGAVRNTATSTGTPPTGPAVTGSSPQITTATAVSAPAVTLTKTGALAAGSTGRTGDTVRYSFTLANSGNVTLTGSTITDPLVGLSAITFGTWSSGTVGTLAPGQSVTATATSVLTQTDVDAGSVANTATGRGTPPTGPVATQARSATVAITAAPSLAVTKVGSIRSPGTGGVGSTIDYAFTVRNSGNVTLTGIVLTDSKPGVTTPVVTWPSGGTAGTLTPNQTATATASYVITQADVDAGSVANTATATGTPPTGPAITGASPASVVQTAAASPSLTTTKSATPSGGAVGATITYSFSSTNSGNVTLTGVSIADPLPGLSARSYTWPGPVGRLFPGQTVTATASYVITQANVDAGFVRNTATASGTSPTGATVTGVSPQVTTNTAASAPAVTLTKVGTLTGTGRVGDTVTYDFVLRNAGNVTLTGSTISDPLAGLSAIGFGTWPSGTAGTLAPGQSVTASATYVLKQSDVDAGSVANTATGRGTPPTGANVTQTRSATVPVTSAPALLVTKAGTVSGSGGVGSVVTYSFSVRNTGNVTLTQVVLNDSKPGVSSPVISWPGTPGTLSPAQTATATATYTVTQADVDAGTVRNTATVTARTPAGAVFTASSPESSVDTAAANPAIITTKSGSIAASETGNAGSTITYTFTAQNAGNVTLTGVAITDPLSGLSALTPVWPGVAGTLAPGQTVTATATYRITQADVDSGSVENTSSATGTPPTGPAVTAASGQITTATAASAPSLVFTKTGALAAGSTGRTGDTVNYTFSLRNSGNVTLSGVAITDPLSGLSAITPASPGTLLPGQTFTGTAAYVLKQTDVDAGSVANTATGTGTPPTGAALTRQSSATVPITPTSALAVTKAGSIQSPGTGIAGDTIAYAFSIRNTGNVTLTQVGLTDSKPGVSAPVIAWTGTPGALAPNQSVSATATYVLTQADVDAGAVLNTATSTGRTPTGALTTGSSPESRVATAAAAPAIVATKTGSVSGSGGVGSVVTFQLSARNAGNVTLTGVTLQDSFVGLSPITYGTWASGTAGTLLPGQTVTGTASYTVVQADVDRGSVANVATARGTSPAGTVASGVSPTATVALAASAPSVQVTKSGTLPAGARAGSTVPYVFTLTNTGNVTLTAATLVDPMFGVTPITVASWPSGTTGVLRPNDTVTGTASYVLTQSDVDAGSIINTVTGSGAPPTGARASSTATSTIVVPASPNLTVSKDGSIVSPGTGLAGDTITYAFTIANTGNVTVSGIVLTDSKAGVSTPVVSWPGSAGTLAPNQTATATASYTITQADVDSGNVANTAGVTGRSPAGATVAASSAISNVTTATRAPALTTRKSGSYINGGTGAVGDVIRYVFTSTNSGNTTLTNVAVTDPLPGLSTIIYTSWPNGTVGTLAPGQSVTSSARHTVTQTDVDAGAVTNVATTTGTPPVGPDVSDPSDTVTVATAAANPVLTVVKTGALAAGSTGAAGDLVNFGFALRNTGNVTLTGTAVTDSLSGISALAFSWPGAAGVLAPGQSATATATYLLTQADADAGSVINTAAASASTTLGAAVTATPSTATITVPRGPALTVTKAGALVDGDTGIADDTVRFTVVARNSGNVTLAGVAIADSLADFVVESTTWSSGTPGTLAPGQTVTLVGSYRVTQSDVDAGTVTNVATATGTAQNGAVATGVSPPSTVRMATDDAALDIEKSATIGGTGAGAVGDVITYSFLVSNVSIRTVSGISVTDPLVGLSEPTFADWPGAVGELAPGESATATATSVITQADVDRRYVENTASVAGIDPDGLTVTDDSNTLRTPTVTPITTIAVTHTGALAAGATGRAGDRVDWAYSLTNTGNVTLTDVTLVDPQPGQQGFTSTWPGTVGELAPGQTVTAVSTYLLTQSDVDAGSVTTTVTGTGTPASGGAAVTATAPATVPITAGPILQVTKVGALPSGALGIAGDVITYSFTISNAGNVTLTEVVLLDSLPGVSSPAVTWPSVIRRLLPGETATATAGYTVKQADVDAGSVSNTASVTARTPAGTTTSVVSAPAVTQLAVAAPSITTTKTATVTGTGAVGDAINYAFVIRNTGNVTLTGVALSDTLQGLSAPVITWPGTPGTLAPNQTATATAGYGITQADVDRGTVTNTASSTGTPPTGPAVNGGSGPVESDTAVASPAATFVKTGSLAAGSSPVAGSRVDYTYTFRNTGNTTLTGVSISDPHPGLSAITPASVATLAPGASAVFTATYTVTQTDVDAGSIANTGTATGASQQGGQLTRASSATVPLAASPSLSVTKAGGIRSPGAGVAGDTIDYSFAIRNSGNVTVSDIVLTDVLEGVTTPVVTWPGDVIGELAPGEVATATASYVILQTEVDAGTVRNTAIASGTTPAGATVEGVSPESVVTTAPAVRAMTLAKSAVLDGPGQVGDRVTYTFVATNTGNVTLDGVSITDPLPRLGTVTAGTWPSGVEGRLLPGQQVTATATYVLDQADLDAGEVLNTARADATAPGAVAVTAASPQVATAAQAASPSILVTHGGAIAGGSTGVAGGIVEWTYSLTNTGNVTLTGVELVDPQPLQYGFTYAWPGTPGVLAPGQTVTATSDYVLTQSDIDAGSVTTIVTGTATPPSGADVSGTAPATITLVAGPAITATKVGTIRDGALGNAGDIIDYAFTINNTGNVTLTLVTLIDSLGGVSDPVITWPATPGQLAPGTTATATATYTITQADVDGGAVFNTATVTGKPPTGPNVSSTSPRSTVSSAPADPSIETIKSAAAPTGTGAVGDTITYSFSARNTGNVTLAGVAVADPLAGLSPLRSTWPGPVGTLAPAQIVTATATYVITQGDIDAGSVSNTATTTASTPGGATVSDASPTVQTAVAASAPSLDATHTGVLAAGSRGVAGDTVEWSYALTNTGNVTLTAVELVDLEPALVGFTLSWPGEPGVLRPGQTVTAVATSPLTQADVDAGTVSTTVTGSGTPPTGPVLSDDATATVEIPPYTTLIVDQRASIVSPGTGVVGDVIRFDVTVSNDGNVTIMNGRPEIDLVGVFEVFIDWPGTPGTIEPGVTVPGYALYRVTQADVDRGSVTNVVDVVGTTPNGTVVPGESDSVTIPLVQATPSIATTKSGEITDGTGGLGSTVTYTIITTNTGNVTLEDVLVSDPLDGLTGLAPTTIASLAPGAASTATATYLIRQADLDRGYVENTASSTATPVRGGGDVTDASPVTRVDTAAAEPTVEITKSGSLAPGAPNRPGDLVTWTYTFTNTGNVSLTGVGLSDPLATSPIALTWLGAEGVLAPGETVTGTATYPITQADLDAGSITSAVTGVGTPTTGGADVAASAPATVLVTASPALDIVQTTPEPGSLVGETITYEFTVTNPGNVTLTGILLAQSNPALANATIVWPGTPGTLAPGDVATARIVYTITQTDVDRGTVTNTETVSGLPPVGERVSDASTESVVPLVTARPLITTTKSGALAAGATGALGDLVTFTIVTTNTGNVTLSGVRIDDTLAGLSTPTTEWPGAPGVLAPTQTATSTATYTLTQADVDRGSVSNTATSFGTPPNAAETSGVSDAAVVSTAAADPRISVTDAGALAAGSTGAAGDLVTWTYRITNTGNVTLSAASVADALVGVSDIDYDWSGAAGVLAPGQTVIATSTYPLTQRDVDAGAVVSTVTARGESPTGVEVSDTATDTVPIAATSTLVVTQRAAVVSPGIGAVGDVIRFDVTVTNTGNVTVTNGRPEIDLIGIFEVDIDWPGAVGEVRPGVTVPGYALYRITQADVDRGYVRNVVDVSGTLPDGSSVFGASVSVDVPTVQPAPAIATIKSGTVTAPARLDSVVTYTIVTTNTGNVTLSGIVVSDPKPGLSAVTTTGWPTTVGTLAPAQSVTSTATYRLTQTDVDAGGTTNTATSTGTPPTGPAVTGVSATNSVETAQSAPAITVSKAGTLGLTGASAQPGDLVTWSYTVTNTGDVTLLGVELADVLATSGVTVEWPQTPQRLAPGETATATSTYPITQTDIDRGTVSSPVAATGTPQIGAGVSASAAASVTVTPAPRLELTQAGAITAPGTGAVGDTITYDFTVRNTGNVTLTGIDLLATNPGLTAEDMTWPATARELAPGQSATGTATYTITQADVDRGTVRTTESATGRTPAGATTTATTDEVVVALDPARPAVATLLTGALAVGDLGAGGDLITYTYTLTNTGNVTLTGVALDHPLPGVSSPTVAWPGLAGILAPGESATATATYAITQADVDAGVVRTSATTTGTPPTGPNVTGPSNAAEVVTVTAAPGVTVTDAGTLAPGATGAAGDTVVWTYTITNSGNVTLTGVGLADRVPGIGAPTYRWPGTPFTLAPGETATATATSVLTQTDIDAGAASSRVDGVGTSPSGVAPATVTDDAAATVPIAQSSSLVIRQTGVYVSPGIGQVGDVIRFTITTTNTGNVTLDEIDISGPLPNTFDLEIDWPGEPTVLGAGETVTIAVSYRLTQADVDAGVVTNVLEADGRTPADELVTAESNALDFATVLAAPAVRTDLTASLAGPGEVDDLITYTFSSTNTGNVTLTDVELGGDLPGLSVLGDYVWPERVGVLEPGQTVTATATYRVIQSDVDRGSVTNTATSTGLPPRSTTPVSDPSEPVVTPTAAAAPVVEVTNTAALAPGATGKAGDRVLLTYRLENTGNVTVTDASLTDPAGGIVDLAITWPGEPGVLVPGQFATATAAHVLTQSDVDSGAYVNTVIGSGTPPTGAAATDSAVSTVALSALGAVTTTQTARTIVAGENGLGDRVEFTFVITNSGDLTLRGLTLTDALAGSGAPVYDWPGDAGALAPGQRVTVRVGYTLTQEDVDLGRVDNSGTVRATTPAGASVIAPTPLASLPTEAAAPAIATTKTGIVSLGDGSAGSVITYTFVISNPGNVTLRLVDLQDELPGVSLPVIDYPGATGILLPGAEATATARYTITQADVDSGSVANLATAIGTAPDGTVVSADSPPSTVSTAPATATLRTTQTAALAPGDSGLVGELVDYTFTVTNTGNVTLTGVTLGNTVTGLTDPALVWPGGTPGTLAPGQSLTATAQHTITQADVDAGSVRNVASSSGLAPSGARTSSTSAPAIVPTADRDPGIVLTQSATTPEGGSVGDPVVWEFTITNTGNVTLTSLEIVSDLAGISGVTYGPWPSASIGTLAPGQRVTGTATSQLTQAQVDAGRVANSGVARGTTPTGTVQASAPAVASAPTDAATPGISVTKQQPLPTGAVGAAGEVVVFSYLVTNTGNVTLSGVRLDDEQARLSAASFAWVGTPGELAPGESVTATARYTLTQADVDAGGIASDALATGSTPSASTVTAITTGATALPATPSIDLELANAFDSVAQQGRDIVYTYTLTNTGNQTLTGVVVSDTKPGVSALEYSWPGEIGVLLPGEIATAVARYTLTQADVDAGVVDNAASVVAVTPTDGLVTDTDEVTLPVPSRDEITLTMGVSIRAGQTGQPGDLLDYRYTAVNTGTTVLTGVVITDPRSGLTDLAYVWPGVPGTLLPGESVTATASWVITSGVAGRFVESTASVTSIEGVTGVTVSDVAGVGIQLPALPTGPGAGGGNGGAGVIVQPDGTLAYTGSETGPFLGAGLLLLMSGLVLVLLARTNRRKEGSS